MHTKIRLHSWRLLLSWWHGGEWFVLTSRLLEHYQSMVDGIRKLDFFFHLQLKDCMEMCICICEYSSTVNCASVFVNIRYTPRRITNTIRYVYLTTSPNSRIYRGTPTKHVVRLILEVLGIAIWNTTLDIGVFLLWAIIGGVVVEPYFKGT